MNCEINFTFDDGRTWTGKFSGVESIVSKPGECDTQDVIIWHMEEGQKKQTKIYWVRDFQMNVK